MGWDDDFTSRAGVPQYPCLIDQKHIVGELYEFINVPMVVWIDEKGRVDPRKLQTVARLGSDYWCRTSDLFEMKRP